MKERIIECNWKAANLHPSAIAAREEHARPAAPGRHRDGAEGQRVEVDLPQEHWVPIQWTLKNTQKWPKNDFWEGLTERGVLSVA